MSLLFGFYEERSYYLPFYAKKPNKESISKWLQNILKHLTTN